MLVHNNAGTACPPLDDPDDGDISCSHGDGEIPRPGDTCTYTCDDGYMVEGEMTVTCQDDGTWSDETTCELIGNVSTFVLSWGSFIVYCMD